jgi:signal peptide peptidase SppA
MMELLKARFAGVPSLIEPAMQSRFEASLAAVLRHPRAEEMLSARADVGDGFWPAADDWRAAYRPYVVVDGILQIPVKGVLLSEFPWALGSWATGYAYITRALERGLDDFGVRAIAFIGNTPGGEVAECFELVDKIFAARGRKPIRFFAHESAYSAGYAIASAAEHIAVSRTGGAGSIGVVTTHVDISGMLDQAGYKITFVHAPEGGHKVDGNPYEALPAAVKARWQDRINALYDIFVATVVRNRGMSDADVRATQAQCFTAAEAVENGLADSIAPLDDAIAAFNTDLSAADDEGDDEMNDKTNSTAAIDAARTEGHTTGRAEGHAAGKTEGTKEGATAERTRISAILGSEEAKGRNSLAQHLAFETDMSADAAKTLLGKSATESTSGKADGGFTDAMGKVTNPSVGADANEDQSDDAKASKLAASIVSGFTGKPANASTN